MNFLEKMVEETKQNEKFCENAYKIWSNIGSKRKFTDWFSYQVKKYGFIEGEDFLTKNVKNPNGRPMLLTLLTKESAQVILEDENNCVQSYTVKQISEILGVSKELTLKKIRQFFPEILIHGKTTFLNEEQIQVIKDSIQENPYLPQTREVTTKLEKKRTIQKAFEYLSEEINELKMENIVLKADNRKKETTLGYLMANKDKHFTSTQVGNEVGMSAAALNALLKKLGFIYFESGTWTAKAEIKGNEYLTNKEKTTIEGNTYYHSYWTQKGRLWILENIEQWKKEIGL